MNKLYALLILLFFYTNAFSQPCGNSNCISIYGNKATGFRQSSFENTNVNSNDTNAQFLTAFAWTDNTHGNPTYNGRSSLRFDLSTLPVGSVITSAKLYLFADPYTSSGVPNQPTYGSNNAGLLQKIINSWQPSLTTWSNQPIVTTTNQKILPQSSTTVQNYVVDITDFATYWLNRPDSNFGVLLRMQTESNPYNSLIFYSTNAPDSLKIRMDVCYTIADSSLPLIINGSMPNTIFQYAINNTYPTVNDSAHTDLSAFTWTDNTHGNPDFLGRSILKYNVSSLPLNAIINSAKLYLYPNMNSLSGVSGQPTYGSNNAGLLQKIISPWSPATLSWINQPTVSPNQQIIIPQSTTTAQRFVLDVKDFVQSWVNKPDSNYGMLFRMQIENNPYNSLLMNSLAAPDSLRPRLEICYSLSLPLSLKEFRGAVNDNLVNLWWTTFNEINSNYITVERSYDGIAFLKLLNVNAKGYAASNFYKMSDNVKDVSKVFYRLKFVDKDGSYRYSNVIMLSLTANETTIRLSPNPASNFTQLSLTASKEELTNVIILDVYGKIIYNHPVCINKGYNSITINQLNRFAKGFYLLKLKLDNKIITAKLVRE